MEQGRCSLTPRTQRRSQNIVLTLQRYIIIWLLPNKIVLFYFSFPSMGEVRRESSTFSSKSFGVLQIICIFAIGIVEIVVRMIRQQNCYW